jgi:hypothetical protein
VCWERQAGGGFAISMHFKDTNHWPDKDRLRRYNVKERRLGHFTIVKTVMWGSVSIRSANCITMSLREESY